MECRRAESSQHLDVGLKPPETQWNRPDLMGLSAHGNYLSDECVRASDCCAIPVSALRGAARVEVDRRIPLARVRRLRAEDARRFRARLGRSGRAAQDVGRVARRGAGRVSDVRAMVAHRRNLALHFQEKFLGKRDHHPRAHRGLPPGLRKRHRKNPLTGVPRQRESGGPGAQDGRTQRRRLPEAHAAQGRAGGHGGDWTVEGGFLWRSWRDSAR